MRLLKLFTLPAFLFCSALSTAVLAEQADRNLPIQLTADNVLIDDAAGQHNFEGNVSLIQGTLNIRAEKIVLTKTPDGFTRTVAHGKEGTPASFRVKRDGRDEYLDGQAQRIEFDDRAQVARLIENASMKSALDVVSGQFIEYNALTENYAVAASTPLAHQQPAKPAMATKPGTTPNTASTPTPATAIPPAPERVHVIIQPRSSSPPPTQPPASAPNTAPSAPTVLPSPIKE